VPRGDMYLPTMPLPASQCPYPPASVRTWSHPARTIRTRPGEAGIDQSEQRTLSFIDLSHIADSSERPTSLLSLEPNPTSGPLGAATYSSRCVGNYTNIGQIVNCFHDEKFLSISLHPSTFYKYLSIFYIQRMREDMRG